MSQQEEQRPAPTTYRVQQLGPPRDRDGAEVHVHGRGLQQNEAVNGFDSLALHHPGDNRAARMENSRVVAGQPGRMHAYVGGRLEEIETPRNGRDYGLRPDQVLVKKDFILSHPDRDPMSSEGRSVEVPSPVAGIVGARRDGEGLVDILDREGGEVIARFRHMGHIEVSVGDRVAYGQTLGIQGNVRTPNVHVHMEMDTRYHQQFRNYVDDLASGRLPIEVEHRQNIQPRAVLEEGGFRLGESNGRIRDLQVVMDREGHRDADGGPLDRDGVYRIGMQGALLDFQRAHGVPQTGDVDRATLQFAPPVRPRESDRLDFTEGGRFPAADPQPQRAPGHPDHPDHRPNLPEELEPAINQHRAQTFSFGNPQLDRLAAALDGGDDAAVSRVLADITQSPQAQAWIRQGHAELAAQQARELQEQAGVLHGDSGALPRG